MTRAFIIVMCTYFFAHAFVRDVFMLRLAPTIHCILTSCIHKAVWLGACESIKARQGSSALDSVLIVSYMLQFTN